jgi:hypothetical protein
VGLREAEIGLIYSMLVSVSLLRAPTFLCLPPQHRPFDIPRRLCISDVCVDIVAAHAAELECSQPRPPPIRPPIMAAITPSPDVSPVSAATTNGQFPRDSFCLNLSTLPDAGNFVLKSALRSPHLLESPNGLFSGHGGLSNPFKKRPRNMSQSSGTDREMSNDHTPPAQPNGTAPTSNGSNGTSTESRPTAKKRPSTDTIDYPRRRATIAVLHNQNHKSRCLS